MKLFVTDIDETLSVGETVSEEVRDACARLRNNDWDIMIATGRTFGTAKYHMRAAYASQPAILYDGGRIMTLLGEEITVASSQGEGSRFTFTLHWAGEIEV